jgi:hypothetical protein
VISNSTASPSANDLKPSPEIAEKWTKTSSPPSCSIKPNPLASLNHFTVPSANVLHHLSTLKIVQQSQQNKKGKNHMFRFLPHRLLQADCTGNRNKILIQKKRYLTCFQKSTILSKSPCKLFLYNDLYQHISALFCIPGLVFWLHSPPNQKLLAQQIYKILIHPTPRRRIARNSVNR